MEKSQSNSDQTAKNVWPIVCKCFIYFRHKSRDSSSQKVRKSSKKPENDKSEKIIKKRTHQIEGFTLGQKGNI